ncbi:hypothetical protein CEXT_183121, partial [Caerostris extrusa]
KEEDIFLCSLCNEISPIHGEVSGPIEPDHVSDE